ncbi:MAG TPA: trimethylamine methyltransferase family protein, partial [Anaerolineae bacterium]
MSGKINAIAHPRLSLNILSEADVHKIHTATLDVIESVGVRFPSKKALDILEANGATVDRTTQVARIPGRVIEEALKKAPPIYTLAARDPSQDLPLDGQHVFLGTDGCCIEVIDAFTGEKRRTAKQDSADCARVADALEEVGFWWSMVSAQDQPPKSRSLHELEAAWRNTTKHLQTESIVTEPEMRAAIDMAAAIVGGRDELRKRPILSIMQCTTSPLGHDGGSLEAG